MNCRLGKFLALFFTACVLTLQLHAGGDAELEQSAKRIFHIEDVNSYVTDTRIDKTFNYFHIVQSKQANLSKQKAQYSQQRQFLWAFELRADHAFQKYMQECLVDVCLDYQDKLFTTFNYLKKLILSFELAPILIANSKQIHNDESNPHSSLS